jgi:hypothetical protein
MNPLPPPRVSSALVASRTLAAQVSALGLVGVPSPPKRQEGTTEMLDGLTRHLTAQAAS